MNIKIILSVFLLHCAISFAQSEETKLGNEITLTENSKRKIALPNGAENAVLIE